MGFGRGKGGRGQGVRLRGGDRRGGNGARLSYRGRGSPGHEDDKSHDRNSQPHIPSLVRQSYPVRRTSRIDCPSVVSIGSSTVPNEPPPSDAPSVNRAKRNSHHAAEPI